MYIFINPELFTFGPELFTVGTRTIVNKNWTTYAHRHQIQRFQFFLLDVFCRHLFFLII